MYVILVFSREDKTMKGLEKLEALKAKLISEEQSTEAPKPEISEPMRDLPVGSEIWMTEIRFASNKSIKAKKIEESSAFPLGGWLITRPTEKTIRKGIVVACPYMGLPRKAVQFSSYTASYPRPKKLFNGEAKYFADKESAESWLNNQPATFKTKTAIEPTVDPDLSSDSRGSWHDKGYY